jgi:putative phosphoesterase
VRLLLISDTHLPTRARDLPEPVWAAVDAADVVIHAGDWCVASLLDALAERARRVLGVVGNNDGHELAARLPEVATAELAGLRIAVVHDTGPAKGREARCAAQFPDTDLLVFGHSHIPWDTRADTGLRLINPGSPTDRRRQPFATYVTAEIRDGELADVVFHRLPPRTGKTAPA